MTDLKGLALGSGTTESIWMEGGVFPRDRGKEEDLRCDVAVIGAGIAGLSAAYFAAKDGKQVVVLDDGPVGMGETFRTTAHITAAIDDRMHKLEDWHGRAHARIAIQAHQQAIGLIETIQEREHIDCGFARVDGLLVLNDTDKPSLLRKEENVARRAGLEVDMLDAVPWGRFDGPALRFAQQGQMHPRFYLEGLVRAIRESGGIVRTGVHAAKFAETDRRATVTTATGGKVTAKQLVIATNPPATGPLSFELKQASYRTYAVAVPIAKKHAPPGLLWDTGFPYHYVRSQPDPHDPDKLLLVAGGEDHRTGQEPQPERRVHNLMTWIRKHFQVTAEPAYTWSGQYLETMDGLSFAGRMPELRRTYVITGDSGMGMTHGTIGGRLVADLIAKRNTPWEAVFDPARKGLRAMASMIGEDLTSTLPYIRRLSPGASEVASEVDVPAGEGRIVREDGKPMCVYRSDDGKVTKCNAICPHMGSVLAWNPMEKSWDCPSHGSRFDPQGRVVSGPANKDLTPLPAPNRNEKTAEAKVNQDDA